MKTRSPSTAMGDGATATLNLRPNSHNSLPSLADTPSGPWSVPYRYCRTPPSTAGITEACVIKCWLGFGVRQISVPVALSSATRMAAPPVATTIRPPSWKGHCPLYQEGMVAWYSVTRLLRQICLPVLASTQWSTALGSRALVPGLHEILRLRAPGLLGCALSGAGPSILVFFERGYESVCGLVEQIFRLHGHEAETLNCSIPERGFELTRE